MIYNRIRAFVERLSPELVCEACVVERLEIREEQMAASIIHELTGHAEFERELGPCAMCGEVTQTTRHKRRAA